MTVAGPFNIKVGPARNITWLGLSTDVKPVNDQDSLKPNMGDVFYQTDNGQAFIWTGTAWVPYTGVGSFVPGTFTYASLITQFPASSVAPGTTAYTTDYGPVYSNGLNWIFSPNSPPNALNSASRLPSITDNTLAGYTTGSIWQFGGTVYTTPAYCASDAAAWTPNYDSAIGTPADVMGTTLTKFAGGTCSMLKGFTGAAIDVAVTIGGVYQIATINILSTGELDNVSLGALMAQADAATYTKVLKVYDQTGNGNHATLSSAAGIPVVASSATVTTSTTLTINTLTTGTVAIGQYVFGNGIVPGTTISSGSGPFILSAASASNPSAIATYFGVVTPPYIDWDPLLGRYVIFSVRNSAAVTNDRRALQLPQAMTFTTTDGLGICAIGVGVNSSDGSGPCLCTLGDQSISPSFYFAVFGSASSPASKFGQIAAGSGGGTSLGVAINCQPCVVTMSSNTTVPYITCNVNESVGSESTFEQVNHALAGGWLFTYGGTAFSPSSMMRLAGIAMFNSSLTAAQQTAMRQGAYARFNLFPQVVNQVALVGDSRFSNNLAFPAFGTSMLLPRYLGRNWNVLNLAISSSTAFAQIGDGLVPTVTGVAASLSTLKGPGLNYAVILLGVNDFYLNSASVATVLGYLKTLCAQISAAGWTPILIAELGASVTNGSNPSTQLPVLNSAIVKQGTTGMGAAAIVNLYGYAPVTTPTNAAFYLDGLHPMATVHQIIASAVAAYI